jgi:hypothetical protein
MTDTRQIAQTIKEQLYYNNIMVVGSWAARNWVALDTTKQYVGGLRFRVSGRLFKGIVQVLLLRDDTYTVELISTRSYEVKERRDGIYYDTLTDTIDALVETRALAQK